MEVSSSTDDVPIRHLAADITWNIADAELKLDSIKDCWADIKANLKFIKEQVNLIHASADESRRDDILCFQILLENLDSGLGQYSDILQQIANDVQTALDH